mmetsp:Transcript_7370/g.11099  ORF Transcript_7370/g.11099 Transcript_7370/m.11099 type:complete len:217 (+) Transcript_7370:782-1432(+)
MSSCDPSPYNRNTVQFLFVWSMVDISICICIYIHIRRPTFLGTCRTCIGVIFICIFGYVFVFSCIFRCICISNFIFSCISIFICIIALITTTITFHDFQEIRNIKMFRQFNRSIPRNHPSNFPQGTHHDTLSIPLHGIRIHHSAPAIIFILPLTLPLPLIIYIHINRNSFIRPHGSLNDTPMFRRRQLPPFPQLQISLIQHLLCGRDDLETFIMLS